MHSAGSYTPTSPSSADHEASPQSGSSSFRRVSINFAPENLSPEMPHATPNMMAADEQSPDGQPAQTGITALDLRGSMTQGELVSEGASGRQEPVLAGDRSEPVTSRATTKGLLSVGREMDVQTTPSLRGGGERVERGAGDGEAAAEEDEDVDAPVIGFRPEVRPYARPRRSSKLRGGASTSPTKQRGSAAPPAPSGVTSPPAAHQTPKGGVEPPPIDYDVFSLTSWMGQPAAAASVAAAAPPPSDAATSKSDTHADKKAMQAAHAAMMQQQKKAAAGRGGEASRRRDSTLRKKSTVELDADIGREIGMRRKGKVQLPKRITRRVGGRAKGYVGQPPVGVGVAPPSSYGGDEADEGDEEDAEGPPPVDYIILIVHGIGTDEGSLQKNVDNFAATLSFIREHWFWECSMELHLECVNWKNEALFMQEKLFQRIVLEGQKDTRLFINSAVGDLGLYMTPRFGDVIITEVAFQLNTIVWKLKQEDPDRFGSAKIALVGHSLGGVIAFDLLSGMFTRTHGEGFMRPKLNFQVEHFFLWGSPIAIFLSLANELEVRGNLEFSDLFKDHPNLRLYNIFHPHDPVAFRLDPIFYSASSLNPELEPLLLPFWRNNGHRAYKEWERGVQVAKNALIQTMSDFTTSVTKQLWPWGSGSRDPNADDISPQHRSRLDANIDIDAKGDEDSSFWTSTTSHVTKVDWSQKLRAAWSGIGDFSKTDSATIARTGPLSRQKTAGMRRNNPFSARRKRQTQNLALQGSPSTHTPSSAADDKTPNSPKLALVAGTQNLLDDTWDWVKTATQTATHSAKQALGMEGDTAAFPAASETATLESEATAPPTPTPSQASAMHGHGAAGVVPNPGLEGQPFVGAVLPNADEVQMDPATIPALRFDHSMQEHTTERFITSLALLQSHFCYWTSKDVSFFMLKILNAYYPQISYPDYLVKVEEDKKAEAERAAQEANKAEQARLQKEAKQAHAQWEDATRREKEHALQDQYLRMDRDSYSLNVQPPPGTGIAEGDSHGLPPPPRHINIVQRVSLDTPKPPKSHPFAISVPFPQPAHSDTETEADHHERLSARGGRTASDGGPFGRHSEEEVGEVDDLYTRERERERERERKSVDFL